MTTAPNIYVPGYLYASETTGYYQNVSILVFYYVETRTPVWLYIDKRTNTAKLT